MNDAQKQPLFTEINSEESSTVNGAYCGGNYRRNSYNAYNRRPVYYSQPRPYRASNVSYNGYGYPCY